MYMGSGGKRIYRLLLIGGDKAFLKQVSDLIASKHTRSGTEVGFDLSRASTVEEGIRVLTKGGPDLVMFDIGTIEDRGLKPVSDFLDERFDVPLIVITNSEDSDLGVKAVEQGAQDYLIKSSLRRDIMQRSILYAVERHRLIRELKRRALIDDLTSLYNRRGFFYLGEHTLSLAERNDTKQFVMFADLDGLKLVNDTRGHEAGDRYIVQAADFLRKFFRESDIIARIGGDEFAVIAQAVSKESIVSVRRRLEKSLEDWNKESEYEDRLSMSIGIVFADQPSPRNLDHFLASADHLMYKEKARKK